MKELNTAISIEELNKMSQSTMAEHLGIKFIQLDKDALSATMPVNEKTHQPYGLLHGGASAALAETVGSVASWLCIDPAQQICVGLEINCNHIRGKTEGFITATARPLHIGATTHVWDIKMLDENQRLICISRLTVAVMKKKNGIG